MGNHSSSHPSSSGSGGGKVILWDGTVHQFEKPLTAAELMLEHPQQVVVEFTSAVGGKKPVPLPADQKLETRKVYLMLPVKRGKPVSLSSEEARQVLLMANTTLRSRSSLLSSSSKFVPWFAKMCILGPGGEYHKHISSKEDRRDETNPTRTCVVSELMMPEMPDAAPEYLSRQLSGGKAWKPSLDTIIEKKAERKVPYWLFYN